MSKNKLNPFDELIKNSLANYEAPYNANAWSHVEKQLNAKKGVSTLGKSIISVGVVAIIGVFGWMFLPENNQSVAISEPIAEIKITSSDLQIKSANKNISASNHLIEGKKASSAIDAVKSNQLPQEKHRIIGKNKTNQAANTNSENTTPAAEKLNVTLSNQPIKKVEQKIATSIDIVATQLEICEGQAILFRPSDTIQFSNAEWSFGNGETARSFKANYKFSEAGTYPVKLQIVNAQNQLIQVEKTIVVNPKPEANFDFETTDYQCHNSSVCFNTTTQNLKYKWNFGDNYQSTEENPKHTYYRKGHYNVKLTVENDFGCKDSLQKQVYIMRAYNLMAPNSFTPNADGQNDTWMPIALLNSDKKFDLKIVDTFGNMVYQTNNSTQAWDGRKVTGGNAKSGEIYFWVAVVYETDGKVNEYGGSIMVAK